MKTRSGKRFTSDANVKHNRVKIMAPKLRKKRTAGSKPDSENFIPQDREVASETMTRKPRKLGNEIKEDFNAKLQEKENQISDLANQLDEALQKIQSDRRKIWNLLSCDICCEILQKPYIFPTCGHTFCLRCIANLNLAHAGWAATGLRRPPTQCPTCRNYEFGCFIKNYVVLSLVEALIDNDGS